jgi:hypothetical protein
MGFKQVRPAQLPVRGIELPPVPPPLVPPTEEVPPVAGMPPAEEGPPIAGTPPVEEVPPVAGTPPAEEVPPTGRIPPVSEALPAEAVVPPKRLVVPPTEVAPAMEPVVPPKPVAPASWSLTIWPLLPPVPPPSGALYRCNPELQAAVRAMKKRPTMTTRLRIMTLLAPELPPVQRIDEHQ